MERHWAFNGAVRLEYTLEPGRPDLLPVVYVPGITRGAEHAAAVLRPPWPRTTLAVSRRGCGQSDSPEGGYAFEDLLGDVEAVIAAGGLEQFGLLAWSFGVRQAVHFAAHHPRRVRGLVLLDGRVDDVERGADFVEAAVRVHPAKRDLLQRIARDSRDLPLEHLLPQVQCPVLYIRGAQAGGVGLEEAERYCQALPDARLLSFEDSGHEVWEPDYGRFRGALEGFLQALDGPTAAEQ